MLPPGLLVVHDTSGGGQHHLSKLPGGQQVVCPLLNVVDGNVEPAFQMIEEKNYPKKFLSRHIPGRDDATLVKPASEVDHNLASTMVINHLIIANVTN